MDERPERKRQHRRARLLRAASCWLILIGIVLARRRIEGWFSARVESKRSVGFEMLTTEDLPFGESSARELPKALTPDGSPLNMNSLAGCYTSSIGEGGTALTIRDGGWELTSCGCIPPGSMSRGPLTLEDGRLIFASNDASGKPTGRKCAAIPIWWGKTVFLLGRDEVPQFLKFVTNVGPDIRTWAVHGILVLRPAGSSPSAMSGHLVLPAEMEAQILHAPLSGKLESKFSTGYWKVNFGRKQGAYAGQRILTRVLSEESGSLDVVSVDEDTCIVKPAENQKPEGFLEGLEVWADAPTGPAPTTDKLDLPPANDLLRAEFNSWKEGGAWSSVPIEDAKELVSALSSNKRHFKPENVICEFRAPPEWVFHFTWSDGIEMLVPLNPDSGVISFLKRTVKGVTDGVEGTYVVQGSGLRALVDRCLGGNSKGAKEK